MNLVQGANASVLCIVGSQCHNLAATDTLEPVASNAANTQLYMAALVAELYCIPREIENCDIVIIGFARFV